MPLREDEIAEVVAIVRAEMAAAVNTPVIKKKAPAKVAKKEPAKDIERPFR